MSQAYAQAGVDYDFVDAAKRYAASLAVRTAVLPDSQGLKESDGCRGESYHLMELPNGGYIASVLECLGTKSLVAQAMYERTGDPKYFFGIGQDTLAMAVNDVITSNILPTVANMYLSTGSSDWFRDELRMRVVMDGWYEACLNADCIWGGGETPALKDLVNPKEIELATSCWGYAPPGYQRISGDVSAGDAIILIESNGIHANGLSLARRLAGKMPQDYLTEFGGGRTYGEILLDPTHLYGGVIKACAELGVMVNYAINVTGHGWRKLMRLDQPFEYAIEKLLPVPEVFSIIQRYGQLSDYDMYSDFNMGAGFALIVPQSDAADAVKAALRAGFEAIHAGTVNAAETKSVNIMPLKIVFGANELAIR